MNEIEVRDATIEFLEQKADRYYNETLRLHKWAVFATVGFIGMIIAFLILVVAIKI